MFGRKASGTSKAVRARQKAIEHGQNVSKQPAWSSVPLLITRPYLNYIILYGV